jgi:fructoselysine-6-P-deglycase FrlB-like protein
MLDEIRAQPDVLQRTIAAVDAFVKTGKVALPPGGRIVLTGCGDMDFSARAVAGLSRLAMPDRDIPILARSSMEMRWDDGALSDRDLVIAASFSGRTPRTVEAALRAKRKGARVIGLTGNARSPMAERVDEILLVAAGPAEELDRHAYGGYHANVPQTKTYAAMLMAELLLVEHLAGGSSPWRAELDALPEYAKSLIGSLEHAVDAWMEKSFGGRESVVILGSGPWRPAAMYGAAKFLEMSIPSRHQCLEEFNHLEVFLTGAESLVIFLCPDEASWTRARELAGPYDRLGSGRLCLTAARLAGSANEQDGAAVIALPDPAAASDRSPATARFMAQVLGLQLLAAAVGPALGRDIDKWVGGVRTALIENLSQTTIRASRIRDDDFSS